MRTIKEEKVSLTEYRNPADSRRQLGWYTDRIYNTKGIHLALGPVEGLPAATYNDAYRDGG
jgi:hypothetical protein